ncbi:MAG: dienelactone hydrolase family protein [Pseudomonadota bacterium]
MTIAKTERLTSAFDGPRSFGQTVIFLLAFILTLIASEPLAANPRLENPTPSAVPDAAADFTRVSSGVPKGDLERTWQNGFVYYPAGPTVMAGKISDNLDALAGLARGLPVVIYMHGCAGINQASTISAKHYADAGYAVVLPNSFARTHKPTSCNPNIPRGGMHREVLGWRHAELAQAIAKLRALPNGANRPLIAHGFSEGAITVATFADTKQLKARIIEGWGCHSIWEEYRGLKAAASEPTLALVASNDPWFRSRSLQGDCGAFMDSAKHQSVVFSGQDVLTNEHFLLWDLRVQNLVDRFVAKSLGSKN